MPQSPPKSLPPNAITLGVGMQHYGLGVGGDTNICFLARSLNLFQTQPLIKFLCFQQLEEKLKGQADYEEVKKELK